MPVASDQNLHSVRLKLGARRADFGEYRLGLIALLDVRHKNGSMSCANRAAVDVQPFHFPKDLDYSLGGVNNMRLACLHTSPRNGPQGGVEVDFSDHSALRPSAVLEGGRITNSRQRAAIPGCLRSSTTKSGTFR